MKIINRTVLLLSLVSLFADVASEMLYPVIPVYLKEIGFSALLIGLLEGLAGFTAAVSKGYFGKQSDESGRRLPFIRWGYFLGAASKPLLAAFALPVWVFFCRTVDRLGKGLRTAARDALLAQNSTPATKARVFGFHRSMDTLGAATGPVLALLLLVAFPGNYVLLFLLAGLPGLVSVALLFGLKEERRPSATLGKGGFFSFFRYWRIASRPYKKLVVGLLLFSLVNSSDLFLLLKAKEVTGDDRLTIGVYILYNLVFAAAAYPLGALADRLGLQRVFLGGLLLFAVVYGLFALAGNTALVVTAFVLYGLYAAATEGLTKAWIAGLAGGQNTATALGFYASCESLCTLLASVVAGGLWDGFGSAVAFGVSAVAALVVWLYFRWVLRPQQA